MNEQYLRALVKLLTKVSSEATINATAEHIVYGKTQAVAAMRNSVKQESVARLTTRINKLDQKVTELARLKNNS